VRPVRNTECGTRSGGSASPSHSSFRIPHSAFRTPHSAFRTPHSLLSALALAIGVAAGLRAEDADLATARNALHDGLHAVAAQHAEARLQSVRRKPAEGLEALQLLLQALSEQRRHDLVLQRLDEWTAVADAARDPGTFAFWRGLALLETGRPRDALAIVEAAAVMPRVAPENVDALQRLAARARLALGDTPTALSLYAAVDRRSTNAATRAANLLEWAGALETVGRLGDALGLLVRQVELNVTGPITDEGRLAYGRLLARQGRTNDAEAALRSLGGAPQADEDSRVQAWLEVSRLALGAGRTNEALVAARSAVAVAAHPGTRGLAGFALADLLLAAPATLDEGVGRMQAFVRAFPESPDAPRGLLRLAEALLRAGRDAAAAAEFRVFLETFGDGERQAAALAGLGTALFRLGRHGEAAGLLLQAHDRSTNAEERAACLFQAGDALLAAGQFRQAADTYRRVAAAYPGTPEAPRALFQAADSLERAGDVDAAQAAFELCAQRCGRIDVALRALLRLGALQAAHDALNPAVETFTQVLGATTNASPRGEALLGRGRAHYRAYRFETAARDFAAAAEADAALRDETEYLQALCLYGLGRDEDARAAATAYVGAFTNAARLPEMVFWLAKFDYSRNRLDEAGKRFLEYADRWPRGAWADAALLWAGRAAHRRADCTQAVELMSRLQREYAGSPRFAESRFVQGDALCELARFAEAVLVFDDIIGRYADSDWVTPAWGRKGDSLFALGTDRPARYDEAVAAYRELLARRDATPEAILHAEFMVGRCLEKTRRTDAAIDQYYSRVIVRFLDDRQRGVWYSDAASVWFVRAALQAAELLEQKGQVEQAERILRRALDANVPGQEELRQRIERLRRGPAPTAPTP